MPSRALTMPSFIGSWFKLRPIYCWCFWKYAEYVISLCKQQNRARVIGSITLFLPIEVVYFPTIPPSKYWMLAYILALNFPFEWYHWTDHMSSLSLLLFCFNCKLWPDRVFLLSESRLSHIKTVSIETVDVVGTLCMWTVLTKFSWRTRLIPGKQEVSSQGFKLFYSLVVVGV